MQEVEESIIRDVFSELDKERMKRAELELQLSQLKKQLDDTKNKGLEISTAIYGANNSASATDTDVDSKISLLEADLIHKVERILIDYKAKIKHDLTFSQNARRFLSPIVMKVLQEVTLITSTTTVVNNITLTKDTPKQRIHDRHFNKLQNKLVKDTITHIIDQYEQEIENNHDNDIHTSDNIESYHENMIEIILKPILKQTMTQYRQSLRSLLSKRDGIDLDSNTLDTNHVDTSTVTRNHENNPPNVHKNNNQNLELNLQLIRLRTERDELMNILDTLTIPGNDAITLASQNVEGTLPLDIVRMLEMMPWDEKVNHYISAYDEVHEWQIWDSKANSWSSKLRLFPPSFSNLPVKQNDGDTLLSSLPSYLPNFKKQNNANGIMCDEIDTSKLNTTTTISTTTTTTSIENPSSFNGNNITNDIRHQVQRALETLVFTDESLFTNELDTFILDLRKGYSLPKQGSWEWIGGWDCKDDCLYFTSNQSNGYDNDSKGFYQSDLDRYWLYSERIESIIDRKGDDCFSSPDFESITDKGNSHDDKQYIHHNKIITSSPLRKFRCRTWKRERVLVSYPAISPRTKHILDLNEQRAKLSRTVSKLSSQVFDMQSKLMEKEEEMDKTAIQMLSQLNLAEMEVEQKEEEIRALKNQSIVNRNEEVEVNIKNQTDNELGIDAQKLTDVDYPASTHISLSVENVPQEDQSSELLLAAEENQILVDDLNKKVEEESFMKNSPHLIWKRLDPGALIQSMRSNVNSLSGKTQRLPQNKEDETVYKTAPNELLTES